MSMSEKLNVDQTTFYCIAESSVYAYHVASRTCPTKFYKIMRLEVTSNIPLDLPEF